MRFYRVKPECDGKGHSKGNVGVVAGELYTEKEINRYRVNKAWCDPVEISKKKTHWFFGARFAD